MKQPRKILTPSAPHITPLGKSEMHAEAICQRSRQCMPHICISCCLCRRSQAAISCEGSPENKALTSPYNGAEHKSGMFFFFFFRGHLWTWRWLWGLAMVCVFLASECVRACALAWQRQRYGGGGETKCGPLAFVIICQFSLRQLPLSSLSDLTQGSGTVTRWQRHLSACAGWNVEVLPLTSACQTAARLSPDSPPLYLFPGNGRRLEIRIIINQRISPAIYAAAGVQGADGCWFLTPARDAADRLSPTYVGGNPPPISPQLFLLFFFLPRSGQDWAQCQDYNSRCWLTGIVQSKLKFHPLTSHPGLWWRPECHRGREIPLDGSLVTLLAIIATVRSFIWIKHFNKSFDLIL